MIPSVALEADTLLSVVDLVGFALDAVIVDHVVALIADADTVIIIRIGSTSEFDTFSFLVVESFFAEAAVRLDMEVRIERTVQGVVAFAFVKDLTRVDALAFSAVEVLSIRARITALIVKRVIGVAILTDTFALQNVVTRVNRAVYDTGLSLSMVGASHRAGAAIAVDHVEPRSTLALTSHRVDLPVLAAVHAFTVFVTKTFLTDTFPLAHRVDLVVLTFRNAYFKVGSIDLSLRTGGAHIVDEIETGLALAGETAWIEPLVGLAVSETLDLTIREGVLELSLRARDALSVNKVVVGSTNTLSSYSIIHLVGQRTLLDAHLPGRVIDFRRKALTADSVDQIETTSADTSVED